MKNIKLFTLNKSRGYTLLELLVVIGLITILMSFAMASYSTAQRKARDSKRKSDLKSIQNGLEQWYSICTYQYPFSGPQDIDVAIDTSGWANCTVSRNILPIITDPQGGYYQCVGQCDSSTYTICPPVLPGDKYLETEDCTVTNPTCCLSNQQ